MDQDRILEIIGNLFHETNPQSIRLRVVAEHPPRKVREGGPGHFEKTYVQTRDGQRHYDEQMISRNGEPITRSSSYCDGERCANVEFERGNLERQVSVGIGHNFGFEQDQGYRGGPEPFRFYHVGLTPLHEALPTAERLDDTQVIGHDCDVFHFKDVGPSDGKQSLVYALDKETSVPLRISAYRDPAFLQKGVPNWVWEAQSLDQVGAHHYPKFSTYSSYVVRDSDRSEPVAELDLVMTIRAEEVEFDANYPQSTFWPVIQPGTRVSDNIEKEYYIQDQQAILHQEILRPDNPIRVETPGTGSWIGGVGALLSIAVLAVAFLLWRRGR